MRGSQIEVAGTSGPPVALGRKEDRDTGYQQSLRETLHDRIEQGAQIGLRIDAAAKLHQRLPVVKTLLIEGAIDPGLDHALQRIECNAGDDDCRQQAPETKLRR